MVHIQELHADHDGHNPDTNLPDHVFVNRVPNLYGFDHYQPDEHGEHHDIAGGRLRAAD